MLNPILSRGAYSYDFRFLFGLNLRDMMFLILEDHEEHKIGFRLLANDTRVCGDFRLALGHLLLFHIASITKSNPFLFRKPKNFYLNSLLFILIACFSRSTNKIWGF
ncbi:hypothetical protein Hanom_Chr16g01494531 [Helianthus anomalus]